MLGDLKDRTALVTGGGQGLGRIIALTLAHYGANVALGDIDISDAGEVVKEVQTKGRSGICVEMDVASVDSVKTAVQQIVKEWGQIDILVNNAGVVGAPGWITSVEDRHEDWDSVLSVNLKGVVNCCKAVIPQMIQRRYGKIITISSTAARHGGGAVPEFSTENEKMLLPYAVTKAAVIRYTQGLAYSLAQHNINVNGVAPGPMLTQMGLDITKRRQRGTPDLISEDLEGIRRQDISESTLFKRTLVPEDISKMIVFLASEDAKNITGQVVPVDGGVRMV